MPFAYPVTGEERIKEILDSLRKQYYDATHHCYAWRLGAHGEQFRANDDGEPSGTAGKPILGQLLSHDITNCLIVVVRYFGGTKLGVSGLIQAYKESAQEVIAASEIIEKTVDVAVRVEFSYMIMNEIMRIVKEENPRIEAQDFRQSVFDDTVDKTKPRRRSYRQTQQGFGRNNGGTAKCLIRYT